jgi:hypothetical protein
MSRTLRYPAYDYADSTAAVIDLTKFITDAIRHKDELFDVDANPLIISYSRTNGTEDNKFLLDASSWDDFVHQREKILYVVIEGLEDDRHGYIGKKFKASGARVSMNVGMSSGSNASARKPSTVGGASSTRPKSQASIELKSPAKEASTRLSLPRTPTNLETDAVDANMSPARTKSPSKKSSASPQKTSGKVVVVCAACGQVDAKKVCPRCKLTRYCGRDCQVAHWPVHKTECKASADTL